MDPRYRILPDWNDTNYDRYCQWMVALGFTQGPDKNWIPGPGPTPTPSYPVVREQDNSVASLQTIYDLASGDKSKAVRSLEDLLELMLETGDPEEVIRVLGFFQKIEKKVSTVYGQPDTWIFVEDKKALK